MGKRGGEGMENKRGSEDTGKRRGEMGKDKTKVSSEMWIAWGSTSSDGGIDLSFNKKETKKQTNVKKKRRRKKN